MAELAKIPASRLVSPNGLNIVDSLFRLSDQDLEEFPSALQYADRYQLNQPRLSQFMNPLKTRSLLELKKYLRKKSVRWWLHALSEPHHRRYLPLFVDIMQPYSSRIDSRPGPIFRDANLFPGPIELAKQHGFLRDENHYYWGKPEALNLLKKHFKLTPGEGGREPTWYLAEIHSDPVKLAVPAKGPTSEVAYLSNRFRALYDLIYFEEARVNEILPELITQVLHEV